MSDGKELLKQAQRLYGDKKYKEVVELLSDGVLESKKEAELFFTRAMAFTMLNLGDNAILDYSNAIILKPNYVDAFINRGNRLAAKKDYDKSISDFTEAIKLSPDDALAFFNRGNAWRLKGDRDKAIEDYTQSLKLDSGIEAAETYLNRGVCWEYIGEDDKAIEDYTKAIALKPDYANAYYNRGISWKNKGEYDLAIDDYTQSISIQPNNADVYNNRGNIWRRKEIYDKAELDYRAGIKINPNAALIHRNLADVLGMQKKFNEAISEYETALQLGSSQRKYIQDQIDLIKTKLGETVVSLDGNKKEEETLSFLLNAIKGVKEEDAKRKLQTTGAALVETLNKIRGLVIEPLTQPMAHYTKLKVADLLVSAEKDKEDKSDAIPEAKFRYYNVVYMNDPQEGKVLMEYLNEDKIKKVFEEAAKGDENNVYLGSFMLASRDGEKLEHEDDLVMWRTYGKDDQKNEATGCSLVIAVDFFGKGNDYIQTDMGKKQDEKEQDTGPEINPGESLFKVIYYNSRTKNFEGDKGNTIKGYIDELKNHLIQLIDYKDGDDEMNKAIDSLVYRFLAELRYMVKSADYGVENEYRVIQYRTPESNDVKIDNNGGQWLPRRLYIESAKSVLPHLKKIILGPKVPNREQWLYLEASMRKKKLEMKLVPSKCEFQ